VAVINPPGYLHNLATHTAQIDRLSGGAGLLVPDAVGSLRPKGGIRAYGDMLVTAQGTPNMTVNVFGGMAYVPQGQSALGSAYMVPNDGTMVVTISAAHATLARRDLICVRVRDAFYTGASNAASIEVVTGTAAASPADPTLASDSSWLILARISVPAAATTIPSGNITNLATPVGLVGGPATMARASLYATSGSSLWGANTWQDIALAGEDIDTHNGHAAGPGYTVPTGQGGLWVVDGGIHFTGFGGVVAARIAINGSIYPNFGHGQYRPNTADGQHLTLGAHLISLTDGQTVTLQGFGSNAGGWQTQGSTGNNSWMSLIREL
jgi:hypothetical protein